MADIDAGHSSAPTTRRGRSPFTLFGVTGAVLALLTGGALWWFFRWNLALTWIIALSVATFLLYAVDKLQAKRGGLRIPENVLHLFALLGGALGGWAGMVVFRHKTRHPIFYVVLALGTLVDAALVWWFVLGA